MMKNIGMAMLALGILFAAACNDSKDSTAQAQQPGAGGAGKAKQLTLDLGNKVILKLVQIPAGKFLMGSPETEKDRRANEGPQREVTISKPFYMGICEVTQEQYEHIVGSNPSYFKGAKNPVEQVLWEDAVEFCKKLSAKTGKTVQLPTEAQWEYACRAGSATKYCFGDAEPELGDYAWYGDNSDMKPHPVGQKKPNVWGLYDMHGNVWEYCQDWHGAYAEPAKTDPTGSASGSYRVLRGGVCLYNASYCRSAYRYISVPFSRFSYRGFRLVLDSE